MRMTMILLMSTTCVLLGRKNVASCLDFAVAAGGFNAGDGCGVLHSLGEITTSAVQPPPTGKV